MDTKININAIPDTIAREYNTIKNIKNVTYDELLSLIESKSLGVGQQYRIIDYVTTTSQTDTQSAGHQFDIIVTADDESTLNAVARAIQHDGDTYFADSDLNAWQIWYCVDNDIDKFAWAIKYDAIRVHDVAGDAFIIYRRYKEGDNGNNLAWAYIAEDTTFNYIESWDNVSVDDIVYTEKNVKVGNKVQVGSDEMEIESMLEGKGVIYRMIDEFNNDCPYDFKNIQFKHPKDKTAYPDYYYTFSTVIGGVVTDHSLLQDYCYNNTIKDYIKSNKQQLNNIVFLHTSKIYFSHSNSFGKNCYNNSFGDRCQHNFFGNNCNSNSFKGGCNSNSFGNNCNYNSFGNYCSYNSFGNNCNYNSFGTNYSYNSFGNNCYNNSFGNGCYSNLFGNLCYFNSFGNYCSSNSFENECEYNSFRNDCNYNSFENGCKYNSFRVSSDKTSALKDYVQYNHFDDGCCYNVIWNSDTTSSSVQLKNINVNRGVSGTRSLYNMINITTLNQNYELQVANNSQGEIKIYCEADLV